MQEGKTSTPTPLGDMPLVRYTAASSLRNPGQLLREMWHDLTHSGELSWRLTQRDISAQYRQTLLGYFWAIFPPLVSSLAFILLNSAQVFNVRELGVPYPVYVTAGTIFWQLFVDALNAPLKVVTESKAIITKINMPKEALVLTGVGRTIFSFLIKLVLLVGVCVWYGTDIYWTVFLTPLPLMGLLLLGTVLGVLLIPVGLLYKDIQHALLVAATGLVFLTPVAYPPATQGTLGMLMKLNPVTPLLMTTKDFIFRGGSIYIADSLIIAGVTILLMIFSWIIYRLALPLIVERIGM